MAKNQHKICTTDSIVKKEKMDIGGDTKSMINHYKLLNPIGRKKMRKLIVLFHSLLGRLPIIVMEKNLTREHETMIFRVFVLNHRAIEVDQVAAERVDDPVDRLVGHALALVAARRRAPPRPRARRGAARRGSGAPARSCPRPTRRARARSTARPRATSSSAARSVVQLARAPDERRRCAASDGRDASRPIGTAATPSRAQDLARRRAARVGSKRKKSSAQLVEIAAASPARARAAAAARGAACPSAPRAAARRTAAAPVSAS